MVNVNDRVSDLIEKQVSKGQQIGVQVCAYKEGEKIVISAQFMLDSESRLREAIQKMLKISDGRPETKKEPSREMQTEGVEVKHPPKTPQVHQHQ